MIHLEGMGILGCYIALRLEQDGLDFTWHDTSARICAWRASTGAIFPSGDPGDEWALGVWRHHNTQDGFASWMEEAQYIYCQKHPPHGGRYLSLDIGHGLHLAGPTSLHLAAPEWVEATRRRFAEECRNPEPGQEYVVTHGFGERLARFMWGWTVPITLRTVAVGLWREQRPCFYMRRGRFTMAYAYPIPGTDQWYAGSSLISQQVPRPLTIDDKWRRWRGDFMDLAGGYVTGVARAGRPRVGWRPVPAAGDTEWVRRNARGQLLVRPLWHSGIRQAPIVYAALRKEL